MLSNWKDIAVFLDQTPEGQILGRQAAALARLHNAHLVGVYGANREPMHPAETHARAEAANRRVVELHRQADEAKALGAGRVFANLAYDHDISSEFRVVWRGDAASTALSSLHCDLIVAGHPKPKELPDAWTGERLLLATGAPVLVVPSAWGDGSIGKTVMIAWNGSREIRRAIADAMPFIATALRVIVLVVGDPRKDEGAEEGATEAVQHLTRHGVNAELVVIAADRAAVRDVIASSAKEHEADLLVIGAYSRPRHAEMLFGGTTRSLLAAPDLPILISR